MSKFKIETATLPTKNITYNKLSETLNIAGHDITLLEAGHGSQTLLWFPAVGDNINSFYATMQLLSKQLFGVLKIIAVNPPGYGDSPSALLPFPKMCEWATAFAQQISGPLYVVGNSGGGAIATAVAAALSERVKKLILVCWPDPACGLPQPTHLCVNTVEEMAGLLKQTWHRPPVLAPAALESIRAELSREDFQQHVQSLSHQQALQDYQDYVGDIAFVGGASDRLITPAALYASAKKRSTTATIIENCGHYPHRECARLFSQILARLLDLTEIRQGEYHDNASTM